MDQSIDAANRLKMNSRKRILIVEENLLMQEALSNWLGRQYPGIKIVSVKNLQNAEIIIRNVVPDAVLLDLPYNRPDSLTTINEIKKSFPLTKVIVLTMFNEDIYLRKIIRAGAQAVVIKSNINKMLAAVLASIFSSNSPGRVSPYCSYGE